MNRQRCLFDAVGAQKQPRRDGSWFGWHCECLAVAGCTRGLAGCNTCCKDLCTKPTSSTATRALREAIVVSEYAAACGDSRQGQERGENNSDTGVNDKGNSADSKSAEADRLSPDQVS
jgi:hypothetical protein